MVRTWGCLWCVLAIGCWTPVSNAGERQPGELFPVLDPFNQGFLQVSELHSIAYALVGNPKGKPIFVLHGGPGFGCYPRLTQYFDPEKFFIVLHDQRGAGRSRPAGELRENTTQDLVADIEHLREHLKVEGKILIFGGSWGSTLALAYAETHPERVAGMVLRGVWTGTEAEMEHAYDGKQVRQFFPDAVARMQAAMPPGSGGFNPQALLDIFTGDDRALMKRVADAWIQYGIKISKLHATKEEVAAGFGNFDPTPGARVDCHYAAHRFFLEEGQLLRDAPRLADIPITIINGRYDIICPPVTAWELHQRLPRSKLVIIEEAGHSESEPGITSALLEAVAQFE